MSSRVPRSRSALPIVLLALLSAAWTSEESGKKVPVPLPHAHAHNDYEHERPLLDALDHGFTSVEADIHLVDGKLLVAHDRADVKPDRTLQGLYLEPLLRRVRRNGGRVHEGAGRFTLLIDLKSNGEMTYAALHAVLADYSEMLTTIEGGKVKKKAITVVISGNRPQELIRRSDPRYAGIDGRLSDLDSELPAHLLPMISDRWGSHFKWRGEGEMPAEDRKKLTEAVRKAHARGRSVRFWATPEKPAVWKVLHEVGVDHINTDKLAELERFLLEQREKKVREAEGP